MSSNFDSAGKSNESRTTVLKKLYAYIGDQQGEVVKGTFFSFLNKLFDIAPEILIGVAIDVVVRKEKSFLSDFGFTDVSDQMVVLAFLTFAIWSLESLFEYAYLLKWKNLAQTIQHRLRVESYGHLQKLNLSFFESRQTGQLVSILNDDINQLERFLNGGANDLIQVFSTVILVGGVFFYISPLIATVSFLPIPVILWGAFYYQRKASPMYIEVREAAGRLGARLSSNILGISTILSFVREKAELASLERESRSYLQANHQAIGISSAFIPIIRMAILAGFLMTFVIGGFLSLKGELNVGSYGVLVFLTQRLLWPLTRLAESVDLFERAVASAQRVFAVLQAPPAKVLPEGLLTKNRHPNLVFSKVSFAYDKALVLNETSFSIPFGSTVAFVGPTGAGKSTLGKLILKFYEPQAGKILWDDKNIAEVNSQELRQLVGWVSQDTFLFDGTIAENISCGKVNATQAEIIEAAKLAHCWEFVENLPDGLNTIVGERGQKLSGGQRQRVAIARAILKNPPILILDEATSAVDNETESLIKQSIQRISKGRTTILIAHRLSTVVQADQIFVLENGRIIANGKHEELLKYCDLYAKLWRRQINQLSGPEPTTKDSL